MQWLTCLFIGTGLVYASRTAIPVAAVTLADEFHFTKAQTVSLTHSTK